LTNIAFVIVYIMYAFFFKESEENRLKKLCLRSSHWFQVKWMCAKS